jgi:hypothetical protein
MREDPKTNIRRPRTGGMKMLCIRHVGLRPKTSKSSFAPRVRANGRSNSVSGRQGKGPRERMRELAKLNSRRESRGSATNILRRQLTRADPRATRMQSVQLRSRCKPLKRRHGYRKCGCASRSLHGGLRRGRSVEARPHHLQALTLRVHHLILAPFHAAHELG